MTEWQITLRLVNYVNITKLFATLSDAFAWVNKYPPNIILSIQIVQQKRGE
jgi:hypothetical protein